MPMRMVMVFPRRPRYTTGMLPNHPPRETWTFHSAGQILFGPNAVRQLGEIVRRLQGQRVLVITDPMLARAGVLDRVGEPRGGLTVEAFTGGEPEPSTRVAETCASLGKDFRPDVVVGLG